MYVASTIKTRLHSYAATVDTALTMIHLCLCCERHYIDNNYNCKANKVRSTPFLWHYYKVCFYIT